MSRATLLRRVRAHKGSTVIFVAIGLVMFLGFAALAVDIGYLYVVRGELQNAADSGALAGAQVLYNNLGTEVNAGANAVAQNYAERHNSEQATAVVESVERGHWSFATRTFTPNNSLVAVPLWNVTAEELDANTDFINAVRVVTRRKRDVSGQLPPHFFATIFGGPRSEVKATAVGYIGFAGALAPFEVDQPIAICKEAITEPDGSYTCGVGRMISSENSLNNVGHQTAGWTNFSQPCDTASASSVRPLVCASGNPIQLTLGADMGTTNGQVQNVYDDIRSCWWGSSAFDRDGNGIPDLHFEMKLPVITCPGGAVGNCSELVGAVVVNMIWLTLNDKNQLNEVPRLMDEWPVSGDPYRATTPHAGNTYPCVGTPQQCWASFVQHFQIQDLMNGLPAGDPMDFYQNKTMYYKPDCTPHETTGITGGENFGVLAKVPVLVK